MEFIINSEISFPKSSQNTDFRYKITVIPLYQNDGYSLANDPNFNTNAPPFGVRGCKVILGGAFSGQGGANKLLQIIGRTIKLHFIIFVIFL